MTDDSTVAVSRRDQVEPYLALARDVIAALEHLFGMLGGPRPAHPVVWRYHLLVGTFMARACGLLNAIDILCENGYSSEAQPLLRSLFELVAGAMWMDQGDHVALADRFVEYDAVPKFKFAQDLRQTDVGTKMLATARASGNLAEITRRRGAYRRKYGSNDSTWYGIGLCDMARGLGDEWFKLYTALYRPASQYAHGNVQSLVEYVRQAGPGNASEATRILYGPSAEGIEDVLLSAMQLVFHLVNVWSKEIGLESKADAAFQPLVKRHTQLCESRYQNRVP